MWRRVALAIVALVIVACAAPASAPASPSGSPSILRVTADDVARAMAEDRFADYGTQILVITGRIGDLQVSGTNARISLVTATSAVVICETFGEPAVKAGDTIQVRARATDGVKDASGVLLRSCELTPR